MNNYHIQVRAAPPWFDGRWADFPARGWILQSAALHLQLQLSCYSPAFDGRSYQRTWFNFLFIQPPRLNERCYQTSIASIVKNQIGISLSRIDDRRRCT